MHERRIGVSALRAAALCSLLGVVACAGEERGESLPPQSASARPLGEVRFSLTLEGHAIVGGVRYQITGNQIPALMGVMDEAGDEMVSLTVNLPAGEGYDLIIAAYRANGEQSCMSERKFNVLAKASRTEQLTLQCDDVGGEQGDAGLDGGLPDASDAQLRDAGPGAQVDAAVRPTTDAHRQQPQDAQSPDARSDGPRITDAGTALAFDSGPPTEDASRSSASDAAIDQPWDGGMQPADAGQVEAPSRDAGPSECEVCSQAQCGSFRGVDRVSDCYAAKGAATSGPARGIATSILCTAVLECSHRTGCSAGSPQDCYCGSGAQARTCILDGPTGACRSEYENAAQSSDWARVVASLSNVNTALGAAARILECEAQRCTSQCSAAP
jgi:hypothetical protein